MSAREKKSRDPTNQISPGKQAGKRMRRRAGDADAPAKGLPPRKEKAKVDFGRHERPKCRLLLTAAAQSKTPEMMRCSRGRKIAFDISKEAQDERHEPRKEATERPIDRVINEQPQLLGSSQELQS